MPEVLENREQWFETFNTRWLAYYHATGTIDWSLYNPPRNHESPTGKGIELATSRLVLISSAGAYLKTQQTPFDAPNDLGDYSIRLFPADMAFDQIAFAHDHYDHTAVNQDPQVLLPLRHLDDFVREGWIGELAPQVISFMGYQPVVTRVVDETIPAIIAAAQAQQAQGALLVPA